MSGTNRTSATIECYGYDAGGQLSSQLTIPEVVGFDYSSDILAVGEECHLEIVNNQSMYTPYLNLGDKIIVMLSNPLVNGGAPTRKHLGNIVARKASGKRGTINIVSADVGWHMMNSSAPLWYNLRRARYIDLVDPTRKKSLIDGSWGLQGVRTNNTVARQLLQGLKQGRAAIAAGAQQVTDPVFAIQAEPGDSVWDIITKYLARLNLLANVSVDGYLQIWNPDYTQDPSYTIAVREDGTGTTVIDNEVVETATTRYTDVECVGEQIGYEGPQSPDDPNAGKRRGAFYSPSAFPQTHRLTFGDGEMYSRALAKKQAEWKWKRGMYDSFFLRYVVPDHHQGGIWWESDTMVQIDDQTLGYKGLFYCAAVQCESSRAEADKTTLMLRLPGFLSASWGTWKTPPVMRNNAEAQKAYAKVASSNSTTTTTAEPNQSLPGGS